MSDFPVLLGDIGGTNARFALLQEPAGPARALPSLLTADFPSPLEAIRAALAEARAQAPKSVVLAVAAPVTGMAITLTNAGWTIDAGALRAGLAVASVTLVNDYVPVAASLAVLDDEPDALRAIGEPRSAASGPKIVLGPGTGLGAGALVPVGSNFRIVSTEAGHVGFGPADDADMALWPHLERVHGRVTAEALLSGPGLVRLYRALCALEKQPATLESASEITQAAASGADAMAITTVTRFAQLLGRFAGDLALVFGARGGVYVGTGVASHMARAIGEHFRAEFERKAPHESLMRQIPTFLVTHPEPALLGLQAIAAAPERFVFDAARA